MDIKSFKNQGSFEEKEKAARAEQNEANMQMALKERNVQEGKEAIDLDYFNTYLRSMRADKEYSKVFLDSLKEVHDGLIHEANGLGVVSSCEVKEMNAAVRDAFDAYNKICELFEENEAQLSEALNSAEDLSNRETIVDVYNNLVAAYKTHIDIYETAREYRDDVLYSKVIACEQLTEDLNLLRNSDSEEEPEEE